jgi:secondary thiamine-phosphate synthase enzyme
MLHSFPLSTPGNGLHDVTNLVESALARSPVADGIVLVSIPHSTAALTLVSPWDPLGLQDVHEEICRLIPTRIDFKHQHDTPQDAAGHVKAAIVGHSRSIILAEGKLQLGHSQRIYFWEFDGPRSRTVQVQVVGT